MESFLVPSPVPGPLDTEIDAGRLGLRDLEGFHAGRKSNLSRQGVRPRDRASHLPCVVWEASLRRWRFRRSQWREDQGYRKWKALK